MAQLPEHAAEASGISVRRQILPRATGWCLSEERIPRDSAFTPSVCNVRMAGCNKDRGSKRIHVMKKWLCRLWTLIAVVSLATSVGFADELKKPATTSNKFGLVPAGTASIHPGWNDPKFPPHATCFKTPEQIKALYKATLRNPRAKAVTSYPKPTDGSLRMVGTAHSFVNAAYRQLVVLARQSGHAQQKDVLVSAGGGQSGCSRTRWEMENGIYRFDKPVPKLMASVANAEWDVMLMSPFYNDRPRFYEGWIDFCLKHNPHMKFYLMDAWPQIGQFPKQPKSEDVFTHEVLDEMRRLKTEVYSKIVATLQKKYPGKVHLVPTCNALTLAAQHHRKKPIPGIDAIHHLTSGRNKENCIWRDRIGHLSRKMLPLEVYVYYATVFGRNPERIPQAPGAKKNPRDALFRKLAWQVVLSHSLTGIKDENKNGIADDRENKD